jgi:hypothetical protein
MWSVVVILIFFVALKTFFPLLAFAGNVLYSILDTIELS